MRRTSVLAVASQAMRQVMQYMHCWKPFRIHLVLLMVSSMGTAVPTLAFPLCVKHILNDAYLKRDFQLLYVLIGVQLAISLAGGGLRIVSSYLGTYIINRVEYGLCKRFYRNINRMELPDIERHNKGEFIERLLSDIGTLVTKTTDLWVGVAGILFTVMVALYFMCRISYAATLLIVLSSPLVYWFTLVGSHKQRPLALAGRQVAEGLNTFMGETIDGSVEIRAFDFGRRLESRLSGLLRQRVDLAFKIWRTRELWNTMIKLVVGAWILGLSLGAYILLFKGRLHIGDVVALGIYMAVLFRPIQGIAALYPTLIQVSVAAQRLLDLDSNDKLTQQFKMQHCEPPCEVELRNVGFAYSQGRPCLAAVSLRLTAGDRVAVVGANGSGKSTLLRILGGLDLRYTGDIYINGIELRKLRSEGYREHISLVPQDVFMFRDSVLNNLAADGNHSRARVLELAREMGIGEVVLNGPGGLDCIINDGQWRFSGGQAKQLAILRALLVPARLVLLDEPFANVDKETEARFSRQFQDIIPREAIVVVATHGYSGIVDGWIKRVVVLENGLLVDDVSPQSFIERYRELMDTQGIQRCVESVPADSL